MEVDVRTLQLVGMGDEKAEGECEDSELENQKLIY